LLPEIAKLESDSIFIVLLQAGISDEREERLGGSSRLGGLTPTGPKERSRNELNEKRNTLGRFRVLGVFSLLSGLVAASALHDPWSNPSDPLDPPDRLLVSSLIPAGSLMPAGSLNPSLQQNDENRV